MSKINKLMQLLLVGALVAMTACGDDDDDDNNDDNDDDDEVQTFTVDIALDPTSIEEGEMATVEVALSETNMTGSTIQIALERPPEGTATPGDDYSDIPSNVRIPDGQQSGTFTIAAEDDMEIEEDETVIISLDASTLPSNVTEGTGSVTLTIVNVGGMTDPMDDDDVTSTPVAVSCDDSIDQDNHECNETPSATSSYSESVSDDVRTIMGNGIPTHDYRNQIPMIVDELNSTTQTYTVDATPGRMGTVTSITTDGSPIWVFGIATNGVKIDPAPAQPFIFEDANTGEFNFDWVFEPTNNMDAVGLDCAIAHVQPDGQYHYHGNMGIYADQLEAGISTAVSPPDEPVLIGWAGDGFPIVYRFGPDSEGNMKLLESGYQLIMGERPGDGITEPCGEYNGKFTNDYEWVNAGDLDECNGMDQAITIDGEDFDYFYVITDEFPVISRCFSGTPDDSFRLGPP